MTVSWTVTVKDAKLSDIYPGFVIVLLSQWGWRLVGIFRVFGHGRFPPFSNFIIIVGNYKLSGAGFACQEWANGRRPHCEEIMITHYPGFSSNNVPSRQVDVWLPPAYEVHSDQRYPVLYMHDGQNLFDPATSTHQIDWGIDEAMEQLNADGRVPPTIVVGVWNTAKRWHEYMPQRPFATPASLEVLRSMGPDWAEGPQSDAYLRFLTQELKPFIDATYRTRPEREATTIMGSSMGGLISLYALCEYPDVFAAAGCVSTHWPAGEGIVLDYLAQALPTPGRHKLYFDYGTEELDALYEPYQQRADVILAAAGYTPEQDWITRKFPGANHSERAWRERVHIPLTFLLGTP